MILSKSYNVGGLMRDRKQHVIQIAHQLFVEKGFQATSIQDILDLSGIAKGTFYNYFSSKNELFIELFITLYRRIERQRNELLIGQDPSNIDIFVEQVKLQMKSNRTNKLISLFEEAIVSNDPDLKQFIKENQLRHLRWVYRRFLELFGEDKKFFLADCAIMFLGILHHNLKFYTMIHEQNFNIHQVVTYSMNRIVKIVEEVSRSGEQFIQPELIENWQSDLKISNQIFNEKLKQSIMKLKKCLDKGEEKLKFIELLDFIQYELLNSDHPRRFLVESSLLSLKVNEGIFDPAELDKLEQLIINYFNQIVE